jgi:hypothetical protein
MTASSRHLSLSPSPAPSPGAASFNIWTPLDYLPVQLANARKRPSHTQLQRLQAAFDASPYITKEERSTLAYEIGLYVVYSVAPYSIKPYGSRDVKFITVWFQNRRQSDKRKAWTKRDRAKKKEKENSCQYVDAVLLKPVISLDRIASRMEGVQRPERVDKKPRHVLSPQKPRNVEEPQTPSHSKPNMLWAHMPSSPPEAPSSPSTELLDVPCLVKSGKSLEWACAKARVGSKHRLKMDNLRLGPVRRHTHTLREAPVTVEKEFEVHTDDENQDVQTSTPSSSQDQHDDALRTTAEPEALPSSLRGKSTEDVEAAMVLLQFLQR